MTREELLKLCNEHNVLENRITYINNVVGNYYSEKISDLLQKNDFDAAFELLKEAPEWVCSSGFLKKKLRDWLINQSTLYTSRIEELKKI